MNTLISYIVGCSTDTKANKNGRQHCIYEKGAEVLNLGYGCFLVVFVVY